MSRARPQEIAAPRARNADSAPVDTPARAAAIYRALLAADPRHAGALQGLARLAMRAGQHDEAVALLERAIVSQPDASSLHADLAHALERLGRDDAAASVRGRMRTSAPGSSSEPESDARFVRGEMLLAAGKPGEAAAQLAAVVETYPDFAAARVRLGEACVSTGRADMALEQFAEAARLDSGRADALIGIGHVLRAQGRVEEARVAYRAGAQARPERGEARAHMADLALREGEPDEAVEQALRAVATEPSRRESHRVLARALLTRGDLLAGWTEYVLAAEPRTRAASDDPPEWRGEPLVGRRVWVTSPAGLAEQILFASCLPDLLGSGAECMLECDGRLAELFARSFPSVSLLVRRGSGQDAVAPPMDADFQISSGLLGKQFRSQLEAFAEAGSYLVPEAPAVERWRRKLAPLGPGPRIGISWRGARDAANPVETEHGATSPRERANPFSGLAALGRIPGVVLVSLEGDADAAGLAAARTRGAHVHHWPHADPTGDVDALAAQVAALDMVVSVDNATAHLAGALGVRALVLLSAGADWCWFRDHRTSPWYQSARLFRQTRPGDWAEVLARVERKLRVRADETPARTVTPVPTVTVRAPGLARSLVCVVNDDSYGPDWGASLSSRALIRKLGEEGWAVARVPGTGVRGYVAGPQSLADFDDPEHHARARAANPWVWRAIDAADQVVINDGGAWARVGRAALDLLYVAYAASVHERKHVRLVNHSCAHARIGSDDPVWALHRRVYAALDQVVCRDPQSHARLVAEGVPATLAGDSVALGVAAWLAGEGAAPEGGREPAPLDRREREGVVIAGVLASEEFPLQPLARFVEAMLVRGVPVTLLTGASLMPDRLEEQRTRALAERVGTALRVYEARGTSDWLRMIAECSVLVTGRFHDALAGAGLGTACVLLEDRSRACEGLPEMIGAAPALRFAAPDLADRLGEAVAECLDAAGVGVLPDGARTLQRLCGLAQRTFMGLPRQV